MYHAGFAAAAAGITGWAKLAEETGYSVDHLRKAVNAAHRKGKPLTKALADRLQAALPVIHEDTPLYTYGPKLFDDLVLLRRSEERARALFSKLPTTCEPAMVLGHWKSAQEIIVDTKAETCVDTALRLYLAEGESLDARARTKIYLAASIMHTLLVVWEDAADTLLANQGAAASLEGELDFEASGLDEFDNALDLLETCMNLYAVVEAELARLLRATRSREARITHELKEISDLRRTGYPGTQENEYAELLQRKKDLRAEQLLIEQDRAIVSLNMASLSSHAFDWQNAANGYRPYLAEVPQNQIETRLRNLMGLCEPAMANARPLMAHHSHNLLIARNLAYMALQHGVRSVLVEAADHLAAELKISRNKVWSHRIANRKPLELETGIAAMFEDGTPIILSSQENSHAH